MELITPTAGVPAPRTPGVVQIALLGDPGGNWVELVQETLHGLPVALYSPGMTDTSVSQWTADVVARADVVYAALACLPQGGVVEALCGVAVARGKALVIHGLPRHMVLANLLEEVWLTLPVGQRGALWCSMNHRRSLHHLGRVTENFLRGSAPAIKELA